jgi:hypothetical protein
MRLSTPFYSAGEGHRGGEEGGEMDGVVVVKRPGH